ncbi:capsid protein [Shewanella baltica]|uniref:GPO family capsid scaffolding protein n=1 Tax=Shewanella baltica TaxID=62322 RepID=UPI00217EFB9C|nr:GPO family capsid scaffolding protein [Shewanella baltica]MCS6125726.1 capsid protein [Shewanella baltica]MCS6138160.1 capsid protein [Shewanella baltica]MCS6144029.1 capsid protein [Shewanella baltica]MCS6168516.1 capsid protein [Shewanella baltica]MCS6185718.1 capsid protein [Shewanella baltica]
MGKQTGWVIAATEGATVDGRTITKQWIEDMAAQYSTDEYTAMIWPEHFRSNWAPFEGKNWGTVDEVKASTTGGKLRLYVKLTANDYLLAANKDGQKLFMSIEAEPDYKGTGKVYLIGLAVTDSPASTGTSRLKFSVGEKQYDHEVSQLEELLSSDFIKDTDQQNPEKYSATEKGFVAALLDLFKKHTKPEPTQAAATDTEEEPMNKEQFDALMGKFDTFGTKLTELETKVETFGKKPEADKKDDVKVELDADKKVDDKAATGITAEQFSKLSESINGLIAKVGGMETKFNALSAEAPNQEPNPTGTGESISFI